jgi:hypothetical protein
MELKTALNHKYLKHTTSEYSVRAMKFYELDVQPDII